MIEGKNYVWGYFTRFLKESERRVRGKKEKEGKVRGNKTKSGKRYYSKRK